MTGRVRIERDDDIAVVVIDNPPVNAGSHEVRSGLLSAVKSIGADPSLNAAVVIGAGRSFVAGSDLREFDLPLQAPQMPDVIAAIETLDIPVIAALHGAALGGGYELALGCDARIAAPGCVVGLPECSLGIIPGAGGTQRLPRLVGTSEAIRLIARSVRVPADEALKLGMVDALEPGDLRIGAAALARGMAGVKRRVIDLPVPPGDDPEAIIARVSRNARPHVLEAIRHILQAGRVPPADGLAAERETFQRLRVSNEAKATRHVFFAERTAARGKPGRAARPRCIESFGVVGSGTMGAGIATAILQSGKPVVLIDTQSDALERGVGRIDDALKSAVARGLMTQAEADGARGRLARGTRLSALSACDLVIEAVFENQEVKQELFGKLDKVLGSGAILATNTSYLDIDRMAEAVTTPENVIGLHFFSPAHVMKLLEVVRATASSEEAMATGLSVARMLGKQPVEAANAFGFIGNRIYAAYRAACEFMLEDGALPQDIDAALVAFGFAMGPFAVADMSGLDIAWNMRKQGASTRDPAERYVDIPDRLCEAGRFGRKTGAGYYRYDGKGGPERDPEVEEIIIAASEAKGIARRALSADDIRTRALAAIVNEAALVVSEGTALRAEDIDVVLVNGYGFPRWKGGPVYWARQQDADQLRKSCARAATVAGPGKRVGDLRALGVEMGEME